MLNVIDVSIFLVILFGAAIGFKRGAIKQGIISIGTFLVLLASFVFKNPVSLFLYKTLPFFDFDIITKNATTLNIVIYEILAFALVFSVLEIILVVLIKLSNVAETIIKLTVILEIPSKIIGAIFGAIESYLIVFIALFIITQPVISIYKEDVITSSKVTPIVLKNTLILSDMTKDTLKTFDEISELIDKKDHYSSNEFNCKSLKIMIDNKFLDKKSAKYLYESKKINTKCGI